MNGPAWHGDSLRELLEGIGPEQADARPIDAHTIHEIVLHIITWEELATGALRGGSMPELPFPEDWPSTNEIEWANSLERLQRVTRDLVDAVEDLTEEELGRTVSGRDYSTYVLLHGVAQHNTYHGGQISLIKKQIQARTS